ncbi:hypothetical protein EVAR_81808_1 [Eumeta japonica]|uniref:Uncharacterized protein n=1 Tax=Eumeta variegata TaxID=151549 RepID=A0A4C1UHG4_EUMVA|nr:hypothetical protein EVAR_81808_1 [Eumeta japonica]
MTYIQVDDRTRRNNKHLSGHLNNLPKAVVRVCAHTAEARIILLWVASPEAVANAAANRPSNVRDRRGRRLRSSKVKINAEHMKPIRLHYVRSQRAYRKIEKVNLSFHEELFGIHTCVEMVSDRFCQALKKLLYNSQRKEAFKRSSLDYARSCTTDKSCRPRQSAGASDGPTSLNAMTVSKPRYKKVRVNESSDGSPPFPSRHSLPIRYPILSQDAINALLTSLRLLLATSGDEHVTLLTRKLVCPSKMTS